MLKGFMCALKCISEFKCTLDGVLDHIVATYKRIKKSTSDAEAPSLCIIYLRALQERRKTSQHRMF